MRHELNVLVAAIGVVLAAGLSPEAAGAVVIPEPGTVSLRVRTYTQVTSKRDVRTARRTASAILERAGIRVDWVECGPAAAGEEVAADACTGPLGRNELVVRLVPAGTAGGGSHPHSLGFAFVDPDAGGGWLATVYADRVGQMAQAAGVGAAELLGRAIAHEIGHLLIGSNQHAPSGLMRASWSGADLRRNRATEWLFGRNEGETMRRQIASRPVSRAAE